MSDKDRGNLLSIIDACNRIANFVVGIYNADAFYADPKTFDAVLMNFIVIGESVSRLSEEVKHKESHIPWLRMKGFRNIIAHNYFGVDAEEVWQIINSSIPTLEADIKVLLEKQ